MTTILVGILVWLLTALVVSLILAKALCFGRGIPVEQMKRSGMGTPTDPDHDDSEAPLAGPQIDSGSHKRRDRTLCAGLDCADESIEGHGIACSHDLHGLGKEGCQF